MVKRISSVNTINIQSVAIGGVFLIGDSQLTIPRSKALAVQREEQIFFDEEGDLSEYSIFNRDLEAPSVTERINIQRINQSPIIHVNHIDIIGVSTSAVFQIGSTGFIDADSRVKHIRQLNDVD